MQPLATERLVIRALEEGDFAAYAAAFGTGGDDERLRRYLRWAALNDLVLADLKQPPYGDRAVVLRETGALVGSVGLVPALAPFGRLKGFGGGAGLTPEVGLYWAIAPSHRGRGLATEAARALVDFAFRELRLRRVVALTDGSNAPSIAVMRRLGMRIERNPRPDPPWLQVVGVLESPDP
jgi:RimJ/RimL family protein N-acetyltransferase